MALTQAAERAALNKLIDYLDEDPKANIDKIMRSSTNSCPNRF